jgi:hypothetical protein
MSHHKEFSQLSRACRHVFNITTELKMAAAAAAGTSSTSA